MAVVLRSLQCNALSGTATVMGRGVAYRRTSLLDIVKKYVDINKSHNKNF